MHELIPMRLDILQIIKFTGIYELVKINIISIHFYIYYYIIKY